MDEVGHHRLRVRFAPTSKLHIYNSSRDKDDEGDAASSLWYTKEEEGLFKQSARREAERILQLAKYPKDEGSCRTRKELDEGGLCLVGLERAVLSREHSRMRVISKGLVRAVVLWEQKAGGAGLQASSALSSYPYSFSSPSLSSSSSPSSYMRKRGLYHVDRQAGTGCRCRDRAEAIAEASMRVSKWSKAQAQAIGCFQALVVRPACSHPSPSTIETSEDSSCSVLFGEDSSRLERRRVSIANCDLG
ncbi:hypothetical protein ACHAW5_002005 [Stephanodiscus triporus]|uniref:Uncharacterized protein n=1 Tax=Stephanodiscus triporus TaxID=2934178 RepID=A0ABD3Q615_9STRA